jgi:ADP-ribose pyrophosphatase YjhB (NUDIX family)
MIVTRCSAMVFRQDQILLLRQQRGPFARWLLPGDNLRAHESTRACARRAVAETTGLRVLLKDVALIAETFDKPASSRVIDLIFGTRDIDVDDLPSSPDAAITAVFYPLEAVGKLPLQPPVAVELRRLYKQLNCSPEESAGPELGAAVHLGEGRLVVVAPELRTRRGKDPRAWHLTLVPPADRDFDLGPGAVDG